MNLKLIVRPEAEDDIFDIALWYEGREVGLGQEVTAEIRAATERALENPVGIFTSARTSPRSARSRTSIPLSHLLHCAGRRHRCLCGVARRAARAALATQTMTSAFVGSEKENPGSL
jgi:plasmid stabilization system protein ParE